MSKILTAALFGAFTLGLAAAPVTINASTSTLTVASAFAKNGADDAKGDDRGGHRDDGAGHTSLEGKFQVAKRGADDRGGDDRGGRRGGGGKGRGGHDDGPGHTSIDSGYQVAKNGADDKAGDDRGGHGRDDRAGDDRGRG
jgi:hypothetical protein